MMVCHISFDESYGIGTDCLVTVEISVVDNSRNLNASFFQSIERKDGQTGCTGSSEDIDAHRRLCGGEYYPEDAAGLTAPLIFSYPASAQLAAASSLPCG